jgi:hypothetical protein
LDKSFLDGVNSAQLQYYAQKGWIFGAPEVLIYEHFRKRDQRRIANLFKLHSIEDSVVRLPGIGEMFRREAKTLKPACTTMRAKGVELCELKVKLRAIIDVWQSLREMPELKNASAKEAPEIIKELSLKIRNDRDDMRGFYANHRHADFPPPELLDKDWAFFRWIQVQLLAGLDFISRHGVDAKPNQERMLHELLDLDYLISALLVGGLACRETRFVERFRFLRSDGVIFR